ncbi:hypothetical protein D3C87_1690940 [compost metagenome]
MLLASSDMPFQARHRVDRAKQLDGIHLRTGLTTDAPEAIAQPREVLDLLLDPRQVLLHD